MPKVQHKALSEKAQKKFPGKSKAAKRRRDRFVFGILNKNKK